MPESHAVVMPAGQGECSEFWHMRSTLKAGTEQTGGAYTLVECVVQPGMDTRPLHSHAASEAWYVLEGRLTVHADEEDVVLSAGGFAHVPGGMRHAFSVQSDQPARFLIICTPSGFETFLRDMAEVARTGDRTLERVAPVWAKHGFEVG